MIKLVKKQDKPPKHKGYIVSHISGVREGKKFVVITDGLTSAFSWVDQETVDAMNYKEVIDYMLKHYPLDNRYARDYYKYFPEEADYM